MDMLLSFSPFIVFALLAGRVPITAALFAAAGLSIALMLRQRLQQPRPSLKLLEIGTALLFGGLGAWVLATRGDWGIAEVRLAVDVGLLVIVLGSMAIGQPFTLQYAREQVPAEVAALPQFRRINYVLTGVWGLAFAVMAGADYAMARLSSVPVWVWVGILVTVGAIVGAVWFTRWYPEHRQRLAQRAGG